MRIATQLVLAVSIVATAVGALFFMLGQSADGDGVRVVLPTATPEQRDEIKVYVSGAVREPGVYTVLEGDRLADVLEMSGGAAEEADLSAVNLAVRLEDEDHWHIPRVGEQPQQGVAQGSGGTEGQIDVNSATASALEALPGIGEVKARSIVSYRESSGPFESVDDLLEVRGIGPATLDSIRDLITVR